MEILGQGPTERLEYTIPEEILFQKIITVNF
jgi:hypothetical protein